MFEGFNGKKNISQVLMVKVKKISPHPANAHAISFDKTALWSTCERKLSRQ